MSYFRPRNLLLILALVLAVALLVVIVLRFQPESQLPAVIEALPQGIDVSLEEIDYTHIEAGVARWRLVAKEVKRQADSKIMAVNEPRLDFFNELGEPDGELRANTGEISEDYQEVFLHGEVVLKNSEGYTLYTERLDYDQREQVAKTQEHVRLVADGMNMEGIGMVYRVPEKLLILKSNVSGVVDAD